MAGESVSGVLHVVDPAGHVAASIEGSAELPCACSFQTAVTWPAASLATANVDPPNVGVFPTDSTGLHVPVLAS